MEQNLSSRKQSPLVVAACILAVAAVLLNVFTAFDAVMDTLTQEQAVLSKVACALMVLSLVFGLVYFLRGFTKQAATFYKLFMILSLAETIVFIGFRMTFVTPFFTAIFLVLPFGLLSVLAAGPNLGKTMTLTLALIYIAVQIVNLITSVEFNNQFVSPVAGLVQSCSHILMAGIAALMVLGKYSDKKERGRN